MLWKLKLKTAILFEQSGYQLTKLLLFMQLCDTECQKYHVTIPHCVKRSYLCVISLSFFQWDTSGQVKTSSSSYASGTVCNGKNMKKYRIWKKTIFIYYISSNCLLNSGKVFHGVLPGQCEIISSCHDSKLAWWGVSNFKTMSDLCTWTESHFTYNPWGHYPNLAKI